MSIEAGQTLLHYRLVEKLGEGGMGVVWKAVDTTLDREVAIKILPDVFAADPDRLARFEREAKTLATLNHPYIAAVYSVHSSEGMRFLAMEYVAGEDLSQRLARGPLPIEDAIEIASQLAEAMETAHDSGVIHRDLKPANIQLGADGKIKVLDFGLAKALSGDPAAGGTDPGMSPTITSTGTLAGTLLGTAAYMSPEQARGRVVDRRADNWAFGCVLYEMLTARSAFRGETVTDTLAAVLKSEPDWDALPPNMPRSLRRLLNRCLTKDPDRRLSHIAGGKLDLAEALQADETHDEIAPSAAPARPIAPLWRRALPWALAIAASVVAAFAIVKNSGRETEPPRRSLTLFAPLPFDTHLLNGQMGSLAISPDGMKIAVVLERNHETGIYLRRLDSPELTHLPGTRNGVTPFFSPDSEWIGFFADSQMKKIHIDGNKPISIAEMGTGNRGASWGGDDQIVVARFYNEALVRLSAGGGTPEPLTTLDTANGERTHRWPQVVPGEDVVFFTIGTADSPEYYGNSRIGAVRPSTGERKIVYEGASMARYVSTGHLIVASDGFLFAVPFDIKKLEATGPPVPVVDDVTGVRGSGLVHAGISENGLLAYFAGSGRDIRQQLVWIDRDGKVEPLDISVGRYGGLSISPDESRLLVEIAGDTAFDIWIHDFARGTTTRSTFEEDNIMAVWSPDGKRIAFSSVRDGLVSTYVKNADGSGSAELLFRAEDQLDVGTIQPTDWSPDGKSLVLYVADRNAGNIVIGSLEADGALTPIVNTPAGELNGTLSPDQRWLAYDTDETGRGEIFVSPNPGPGGKWQISTDGGFEPLWSADGKQIYYRWGRRIFMVEIDTSDGFRPGTPEIVFDNVPPLEVGPGIRYAVSADGQRVLLAQNIDDEGNEFGITVKVNWLEDVARRVR